MHEEDEQEFDQHWQDYSRRVIAPQGQALTQGRQGQSIRAVGGSEPLQLGNSSQVHHQSQYPSRR